jgi:hypothetical protein
MSTGKSEPYNGPISAIRRSPYLASSDIIGLGDLDVEIEGIFRDTDVDMGDGRKEAELFTIKFVGQPKRMVINAANLKVLSKAFGAKIENWKGQKVKLYVLDNIKAFGKLTTGLRLKTDAKVAQQKASDTAQQSMLDKVKK